MDLARYRRRFVDTLRSLWYRARYERARVSEFPFDEPKFHDLVLYIANAFRDDERFGRIKHAKLIYNSDFRAYRRLGHPISGATYIKDTWGHNPKQLLTAERDLEAQGLARIVVGAGEEEPRFIPDTERRRLIPTGDDVKPVTLSRSEVAIVDEVIDEYRRTPGIAMSDESHKTLGWRIAKWHEEIPYASVSLAKPSERDLEHGRTVARKLRELGLPE
jgi:Protein of unknown function (DUF4065)